MHLHILGCTLGCCTMQDVKRWAGFYIFAVWIHLLLCHWSALVSHWDAWWDHCCWGFFLSKRDYCHSEHCVRPGCELDPKAGQITLVDPLTMNGKQIFLHCCFGGKEMVVVCVSSCSIDTSESNISEQNSISSSSRQQLITAPSFQAEPSVGKTFFFCHCGFNWSHQSSWQMSPSPIKLASSWMLWRINYFIKLQCAVCLLLSVIWLEINKLSGRAC